MRDGDGEQEAETPGEPQPDLDRKRVLLYAAASLGTGVFYSFNNFVLPPVLKTFGAPDLLVGLLASTRSVEGAVIQPTIGALSDRIWTRFGRRRPFMLVAIPLSAAFLVASAYAGSLVTLAVMIFCFSIFFNVAVDPYTALLADITPLHQRGWLSGVATAVQMLSSVVFLAVIAVVTVGDVVPAWTYAAVGIVLVVSFGVTIVGVPEHRDARAVAEHQPLRSYLDAVLQQRQAVRYLGTLFVYQFGLNAILPYLVLFVVDVIHQSEQIAFALSAGLLVVTAAGAIGFGRLADRIGTRPVLAIGWGMLALSALAGCVITTLPQLVVVVVLAGAGNGAATAVAWPLLTALIPEEKTGIFAGLKAAADSIAVPLSVVVAAEIFLPTLGYRGIFAMLAVSIIAALVLLLRFVRVPPRAEPLALSELPAVPAG
jgi:Na+/melibiose symporter-like transporter